jgi:hypothetical protein
MRKFRIHFNRVNMQRGNPNVWTVHTSNVCYQVREVKVYVPVETHYNPTGQQPRAYFTGRAYIEVRKGVAVLSY